MFWFLGVLVLVVVDGSPRGRWGSFYYRPSLYRRPASNNRVRVSITSLGRHSHRTKPTDNGRIKYTYQTKPTDNDRLNRNELTNVKIQDQTASSNGRNSEWDAIWRSTGTVPDKLSRVPEQPLVVSFGTVQVTPNIRLEQSQLGAPPTVSWEAEAGGLYTLLLEDNDLEAGILGSDNFKIAHWMVSNIPGSRIEAGDENYSYIPSGPFRVKDNGTKIDTSKDYTHRYIFLVYKQQGKIEVTEGQIGICSSDALTARIVDHNALQLKYNLQGPVAGNFYRTGFSQKYFNRFSCQLSKCLGTAWPFSLPGMNDGPECKTGFIQPLLDCWDNLRC